MAYRRFTLKEYRAKLAKHLLEMERGCFDEIQASAPVAKWVAGVKAALASYPEPVVAKPVGRPPNAKPSHWRWTDGELWYKAQGGMYGNDWHLQVAAKIPERTRPELLELPGCPYASLDDWPS